MYGSRVTYREAGPQPVNTAPVAAPAPAILTGSTISKFGTQFRVILGALPVTVQTKSHIEGLWILGNIHFTHIAMTILAIDPRCNMWTMIEMHKIRHNRHRDPFERLVILHGLDQRL